MIRRHLFIGIDDEARAKRSLFFGILVVLFLSCVGLASAFLAGFEYRSYLAVEEKRAEQMKPKKATPASFTPLLSCTKEGLQEWHRTCRARNRMTGVEVR